MPTDHQKQWDDILSGVRGVIDTMIDQDPANADLSVHAWGMGKYAWQRKGIRVEGHLTHTHITGRKPFFICKTAMEARTKMPVLIEKLRTAEVESMARREKARAAVVDNGKAVDALRARLTAAGYTVKSASEYTLTVELSVGTLTFDRYSGRHWDVEFDLVAQMQNELGMVRIADILSGKKTAQCE